MQTYFAKQLTTQGVETADTIYQPQLKRLLTTPDQATEETFVVTQALATPQAHSFDKLCMGDIHDLLPKLSLLRRHGRERIEKPLVVATGIKAALDANAVNGF